MNPAIGKALEAFGLTETAPPAAVEDSILNQNYRVETTIGVVFLRAHRLSRTLERLQREQSGAAWAGARGLATPRSLTAPGGDSIVALDGQFWSVSHWIEGSTYRRGAISPMAAHRLGVVHGRCVEVLKDYPGDSLPPNSELTWSTAETLTGLQQVAPHVHERGTEQERRWHQHQLELVESGTPKPPAEFAWVPRQPSHGDFHERNVMFDVTSELAAVVDWERFCVQPPAFEVLRAVSFMLLLEETRLRAYLTGFREHIALDPESVGPCVDAWWQSSLHNTWAFRDYFLAGNEGSRQFLPEEEERSARFNDPEFRKWLTEMLTTHAC